MERAIVWTILCGSLIAVSWQWYCRDSYSRTLTALDAEVNAMRDSMDKLRADLQRQVTEGLKMTPTEILEAVRERTRYRKASEIPQFIHGFPFRTIGEESSAAGPMRLEIYVWRGPFRSYELDLKYELGDDPRLVTVDTRH